MIAKNEVPSPSMLLSWNSPRRWTLTSGKNLRRIVNTDDEVFVVAGQAPKYLALYRSNHDNFWIKVAETETLQDAKAALLPCALDAGISWV